ncbi:unnamed protein product [Leptidea sinapis]|uniref:Uncharacterized protein n=1 Tax=Leptidea sinapis TaxID=189913 RepID=A0A5E4PJX6_9NEOP|nr:unnamed protein product [Leptidea sinapis]
MCLCIRSLTHMATT